MVDRTIYLGFLFLLIIFCAVFLQSCYVAPQYYNRKTKDSLPTFQIGIASYYADQFHGRKTSNGEIFNMNDATAAHRTMPFGCKVRVTNIFNGRSTVVRINDRGPFRKGRIIDLSKSAAEKIGVVENGIAPVKLEIISR